MKLRAGFWIWLFTWLILFLLQHTRLRPFPHIVIAFWLVLPLGALFHLWMGRRDFRMAWNHPIDLVRNRPFPVELQIRNTSSISTHTVFTQDQDTKLRTHLDPDSREVLTFTVESSHTGSYPLPDRPVYLEEPFGLFRLPLDLPAQLLWILPLEWKNATQQEDGRSGQSPRTAEFQDGRDEMAYVEPHPRGKPMRHIHWKLSARMQQWLTRHMDDETDPTLLLIVLASDSRDGIPRTRNDRQYDYAYTLAKESLARRQPLRLFTKSGATDTYSRPEQARLIRSLLAMQAANPMTDARNLRAVHTPQQSVFIAAHRLDTQIENELLSLRERVYRLTVAFFSPIPEGDGARLRAADIHVLPMEEAHANF